MLIYSLQIIARLAQSVELRPLKLMVVSSNPTVENFLTFFLNHLVSTRHFNRHNTISTNGTLSKVRTILN